MDADLLRYCHLVPCEKPLSNRLQQHQLSRHLLWSECSHGPLIVLGRLVSGDLSLSSDSGPWVCLFPPSDEKAEERKKRVLMGWSWKKNQQQRAEGDHRVDINLPPQDPSKNVHSDLSGVMDNSNRVKSIDKSVSEEDGGAPSRRTDRVSSNKCCK